MNGYGFAWTKNMMRIGATILLRKMAARWSYNTLYELPIWHAKAKRTNPAIFADNFCSQEPCKSEALELSLLLLSQSTDALIFTE
jgi:hypothetical protein